MPSLRLPYPCLAGPTPMWPLSLGSTWPGEADREWLAGCWGAWVAVLPLAALFSAALWQGEPLHFVGRSSYVESVSTQPGVLEA